MAKSKKRYVCEQCGSVFCSWFGRCPHCGEWNAIREETIVQDGPKKAAAVKRDGDSVRPALLNEIAMEKMRRLTTGIAEVDRVLGGGIVPGALMLLSGDPGIGKSTLVLQLSVAVSRHQGSVLYASGEESAGQIKLRADRLRLAADGLWIQADTFLDAILSEAEKKHPGLLIIDSIQTMYGSECDGAPGSMMQIREGTNRLLTFAKTTGIPVIVIGHVTKDGNIAGPRVMEHLVDVVLYLEGERQYPFRILRSIKNRFGSTDESGLFTMTETGLTELDNPSSLLLAERATANSGSAVVAVMDGMRPLMGEIQALTTRSVFSVPRRTAVGMDYNRLIILLAVLEKRVGLSLAAQDVYLTVVGGLKITETAADLPILLAILSSCRDSVIDSNTVCLGEVGLTGEIRRVPHCLRRIREAVKLGFKRFIIPRGNHEEVVGAVDASCRVIAVATLQEAVAAVF
ncbi:DNA repair protein RadA [Megasphaera vaginalis (ex Bordigoni et al. 2020)]|uniref:DNA repair protein RadA n=1 Tax=Megasphaera vaginalis (ex Bordigoni et al. 2020) TaxID=2045301 RepID=UPI000C79C334|nr:DNA repair protein RadA [Megasphaera vaginalis (ex Bordigoni et al. 2020)]